MYKEKLVLALLLIALLGCLYTMATVGDYQEKCNEHWQQQLINTGFYDWQEAQEFNQSPVLPLINIKIELEKD